MEDIDIKQLLTDFNLDPENEKVNAFFERENIWKILDIQRRETSHSAFLAWFFKQNVAQYSHLKYFLNLLALKVLKEKMEPDKSKEDTKVTDSAASDSQAAIETLVNAILTGSYTINSVSVVPEMLVNKLSTIPDTDRLDVYMRCGISLYDVDGNEQGKTLEIFIENKVDSKEGKPKTDSACAEDYKNLFQTERYYFACSKESDNLKDVNRVDYQLFVYLTPSGGSCKCPNFIRISYQELVDYVFENFLRRSDVEPEARSLVEAYLHNLGNPYNKDNKEIIAMATEERDLLVGFYNRNKKLFETTIEAMRLQAEKDGDEDEAKAFKEISAGLENARKCRRRYTINGVGCYTMRQVIEEYIKKELDNKKPFDSIVNEVTSIKYVGEMFISEDPDGVSIASGDNAKPYSFEHNGKTYYVTTQLRDNKENDNFRKFREKVSNDNDFLIIPIDK